MLPFTYIELRFIYLCEIAFCESAAVPLNLFYLFVLIIYRCDKQPLPISPIKTYLHTPREGIACDRIDSYVDFLSLLCTPYTTNGQRG